MEVVTVILRGEKWRLVDNGGEYWLRKLGDPKGLRYPNDLSEDEVGLVSAAWRLAIDERKRKDKLYSARYRAMERRESEELKSGAVRIRGLVWHVEEDHIWRETGRDQKPVEKLRFSDLTQQEIAKLLDAREREVKSRGLVGFLRKMYWKLDR